MAKQERGQHVFHRPSRGVIAAYHKHTSSALMAFSAGTAVTIGGAYIGIFDMSIAAMAGAGMTTNGRIMS
jgi:hypothetical protein